MAKAANLGDSIRFAPSAFDADAAERLRDRLGAQFSDLKDDERALILGVAGCSPYLHRLMARAPDLAVETLRRPPEASLAAALERVRDAGAADDPSAQMEALRRAKSEAALAVALAEIAGAWDVMTAARALSEFADAALEAALGAAARSTGAGRGEGVCVIAMGKLGAMELNFSSDIDLIVLFDPGAMAAGENAPAQKTAVNVTRRMISLLQTQTPGGYVFRTDLRLRPDPGVSPVAVSFAAAETYYESFGQNWERMAFIKARAAAGAVGLGDEFLSTLRPFVWRKFLDFAAIEDAHAVKRHIHAARGGASVEFAGHNIKLGRGGIREIEFFVQTLQLILGGKSPGLRQRATLDALAALDAGGRLAGGARAALDAAYRYLRQVEHRLQMINDEQTHIIPKRPEALERLARFLGEECVESFRGKLTETLLSVRSRYDGLFSESDGDAPSVGPLAFAGVESDPETNETLQRMGFERVDDISERIRRWRAGAVRATRTARARQLLTRLVPALLTALSKAGSPDEAFFAFSAFLERLPAGVQVFSLLSKNIELFDTLIRILTFSPYLGRELPHRINFVEYLLEKGVAAPPPALSSYRPSLEAVCARARSHEETLNVVRRWAGEQKFLIAAHLAIDAHPPDLAAAHFTAIAEACICVLAPSSLAEMQSRYGRIAGDLAVVGLGRLGGGELTASSDIDLMFIYDGETGARSDGARALTLTEYFTRLVRRIVTALSAATEEGALYEVDMQLRPSGAAGPTAVSFSAFQRYYERDAWTWEIMALTKARIIGAGNGHTAKVEAEIGRILRRPRARAAVAADVDAMRARRLDAKAAASPWDVKNAPGGLTDIAFVCQFLAIAGAGEFGPPPKSGAALIDWLVAKGALSKSDGAALAEALAMYEAILHAGRAATGGVFQPGEAGETLRKRMASICGAGAVEDAERVLTARQARVAKIYQRIVSQAAAAGKPS